MDGDLDPVDPYAARPWLASYPDDVPADFDFPRVPLTRFLDDAARSFPTRTAIAFLGTTMTYRELLDAVDRFAAALAGLGVRKGDRVALVLPNCPQNMIAFYAALRLGAVVVQHNPLYTAREMGHQLADCGARVAVVLDRVYETVAQVRSQTALEHVVVTSVVDYLPTTKRLLLRLPVPAVRKRRAEVAAEVPKDAPALSFTRLLAGAAGRAPQAPIDPDEDVALLQYTGGTTGLAKGAMLTHANLVANAYQGRLWLADARAGRETTLAVLPLFHAYGLTLCLSITVLMGGRLVLLPKFDLGLVFDAIDEWRPTIFPGVPPIYQAIIDSDETPKHDLRSIRACVSGAMKLPLATQERFEEITGGALVEGYGMTETSPITHANPLVGRRKSGTIGLPITGTRCRVVDPEDPAVTLPPGQPGELVIAGPQVMRGYWQRPEETAATFTADGYLRTGDIAVMDEDGYFSIVDRKKELIIAGGFNIYPSEVEEVLHRHPAVADCAVVGVPDRYRGETVKAYVVVRSGRELTAEEVIAYCREQLAAYKAPKLVEFREELPRTIVGKVLRRVLLEEERAKAEREPGAAGDAGARRVEVGSVEVDVAEAGSVEPVTAGPVEPAAVPEPVAVDPVEAPPARTAATETVPAEPTAAAAPTGPAASGQAPAKRSPRPAKKATPRTSAPAGSGTGTARRSGTAGKSGTGTAGKRASGRSSSTRTDGGASGGQPGAAGSGGTPPDGDTPPAGTEPGHGTPAAAAPASGAAAGSPAAAPAAEGSPRPARQRTRKGVPTRPAEPGDQPPTGPAAPPAAEAPEPPA